MSGQGLRRLAGAGLMLGLVAITTIACSSDDDDNPATENAGANERDNPDMERGGETGHEAGGNEPPSADETGPELPEVEVHESLTSDVQPGWTVHVRGVVRGPGELSTLLLDLQRGDTNDTWPQGLGSDDRGQGLGGVEVIDPEAEVRYRMVGDEGGALSSGDSWYPDPGETMPVYAVFRALDEATSTVSVEVPTFGRVDDVPVVDWEDGDDGVDAEAAVKSTIRIRGNPDLRLDVLAIGRLAGDHGTLVRARLVNEGDGEATTTFGTEGDGDDLCYMEITDPSTGDYLWAWDPCQATSLSETLATGDQAVYEVRFPNLPEGVETLVFSGGAYFPSAPVVVEDEIEPWDIEIPAEEGEPRGGTLVIPEGTPDGSQTTTRTEDTVEIELAADVTFEFDSADLTPEARSRIEALAADIAEQARAGTITVTGYTDSHGEDAYNQSLSEQRAEAVRAVLEPVVGRSDLTWSVSGRGEADPVAPNEINGQDNPDGRARNRRVTIVYEAG